MSTAIPRFASAGTTISMIGLAGHPSWQSTKDMVKAYKKVDPNVEIKLSEFDLPSINDKVNLDFMAKRGDYDIVWMNSALTIGYWSKVGIVTPLDPFIDSSYDVDDFITLARGIGTMGGKLYGIPIMIEDRMLSYRKDVLAANGLRVPRNVQEMTLMAESLTDRNKNFYGFTGRVQPGPCVCFDWVGWLYSFGGQFADSSWRPQLSKPEAIDSLVAFDRITRTMAPSSNRCYGEVAKELQTGVAAMGNDVTIITPLLEGKDSNFAGKFGYAVAPAGPVAPRPMTSSHLLGIASSSKKKDAAWKFLNWMTSKENNRPWVYAGGAAFRKSMYKDRAIINKFPMYPLFKDILDKGSPDYIPRIKPSMEIMIMVGQEISACLNDIKTPKQAMVDANSQLGDILKRNGFG